MAGATDPLSDEDLRWFSNHVEPYNEVVEKWKKTMPKRILLLRTSCRTIDDYFTKFPALKEDFGHQLILMDFSSLHPGKDNILLDSWQSLTENLLDLVKKKQRDRTYKKHLEADVPELLMSDPQSDTAKSLFCLLALPSLCATIKFQSMKFSRKDVKDSFVLYVPVKSQLMKLLRKRSEENRRNGTIFPIPVFVGDVNNPDCYVEFNDNLYSVDSPIQAVDVAFKIFYALNLKYPPACEIIWTLFQHYIFKFSMSTIRLNPQLEALAVDLGIN
nr:PREDICTED: uncharacterized protein LOC109037152 [Bemisia tabaci]